MKQIKIYSKDDFPVYLPKLNQLYEDLFSGGKGFRARLVQQVSTALGQPDPTWQLLSQTIEFIHNASLLHDDLIDRSSLRRGKPAAWFKYTPEYAVLAGDYLLARVMVNLSRFGRVELIQFTAEVISDLLEGEWIQDSLVRDFDITLAQLDQVHHLKTGSLFKWCLRAPFMAGETYPVEVHSLVREMGHILGLLFQRSDDLLDFNVRNQEGKAILGDLKSGYMNSISVFACQGVDDVTKSRFIRSQTLADVELALGRERWQNVLEQFDAENEKLIQLYHHHVHELMKLLEDQQVSKLLSLLESLPRYLYWREGT